MFKKIIFLSILTIFLVFALSVFPALAQDEANRTDNGADSVEIVEDNGGENGELIILDSSAGEAETIEEEEPEITAEELEVEEPGLLGWFKNNIVRNVQILITRDPVKKSELELKKANYQLLRVRKLVEENPDDAGLQERLEGINDKYQTLIERINQRIEEFKQDNSQAPKLKAFLDKYTDQQLKHQQILQKLEEKAPERVMEKIRESRQRHLRVFGEVMTRLQSREEFKERVTRAIGDAKDKIEHRIRKMEILEELGEKAGAEIKEKIGEIKEEGKEIFQNLKEKREEIRERRQELKEERIREDTEESENNAEAGEETEQELEEQARETGEENFQKQQLFKDRILPKIKEIRDSFRTNKSNQ